MQTVINMAYQHSSLLAALPITPTSWIPTATVSVATVLVVAALVYALSSLIRSENAKVWSRFQIYEAFLSIVLILAFGSISYLFFLSPQTVFSKLNLVPAPCTSATQLYTLAACDIGLFNNASFSFARYALYTTYLVSLITGLSPDIKIDPIPATPSISIEIKPPSIFPSGTSNLVGLLYTTILFTLIFNQLQLIILAGSVLFLSFFLTIGLVARTLGFLRTFGGAMIAFGLGLGVVYPLIVSITYGYIDVSANLACLQSTYCAATTVGSALFGLMFSSQTYLNATVLPAAIGTLFTNVGYIIAGLTIIPVLNIAIVDAFIIDFSSAIGEKMSFGQLFSNLI